MTASRTTAPRYPDPTPPSPAAVDRHWAYALLRLLLGIAFLGHGVIRIVNGIGAFAAATVKGMAAAPLPPALVSAFAHAIPIVELALGVLLILGLFTRWALIAGLLFMSLLMAGVTLKQDWPTAGLQLIYGVVFWILLHRRHPDDLSWPALLRSLKPLTP